MHSHTINILFRLITYASSNKVRFSYHWSELWRSLLTLTRFLTTYSADLSSSSHIQSLTSDLIDLITFCISAGDTFLPDPSSYDDLFYKVVEADPILNRFRSAYKHLTTPSKSAKNKADRADTDSAHSINTLISVSTHFHSLLFLSDGPSTTDNPTDSSQSPPPAAKKKRLSPREVHQIIKEGYATLSVRPQEDLSNWDKWRETDWKPQLKRIARTAVDDTKTMVSKPEHAQGLMEIKLSAPVTSKK